MAIYQHYNPDDKILTFVVDKLYSDKSNLLEFLKDEGHIGVILPEVTDQELTHGAYDRSEILQEIDCAVHRLYDADSEKNRVAVDELLGVRAVLDPHFGEVRLAG